MRSLVCLECGFVSHPVALFLSKGLTYWADLIGDDTRYDAACRAREREPGAAIHGCRHMRRAIQPWLASEPAAVAPEAPVFVSLKDLVELRRSPECHGISEITVLAPAGQYGRRAPASMDTAPLSPLEFQRRHALGGGQRTTPFRRLFMTRGDRPGRRLANEPDIVAICQQNGFEVVRPEQLTLRAQAALFDSASVVVGVKGAAMTNILFCQEAATTIFLSPADFADPFFWDIAGQPGLGYHEIFGPLLSGGDARGQNPFTIDPERFAAVLNEALSASPGF